MCGLCLGSYMSADTSLRWLLPCRGTLTMIQTFLLDAACWFEHMALDPITGMDPQGIKIRSALGLEVCSESRLGTEQVFCCVELPSPFKFCSKN